MHYSDRLLVDAHVGRRDMKQALVSVIVVCTNDRKHLKDCFSSVLNSHYPRIEVIMVDNASSDDSVSFVEEQFPSVKILRNKRNIGFSRSNNRGVKESSGEYIFLLNPDTITDPQCIARLVKEMERHSEIGICGAKMLMEYERKVINSIGHNVNRIFYGWDRGCFELDKGLYNETFEVPSVCNGAALYRREIFNDIGLFDERLFVYCDDLDYGIRANLCGYKVVAVPSAKVYHKINIRIENPRHHEFEEHRYRLRILLKNCPKELLEAKLKESILFDIGSIKKWLQSGDYRRASYRLRALLWNLLVLPDTMRERKRIQRKKRADTNEFNRLFIDRGGYPFFNAPVPDYEFRRNDRIDARSLDSGFIVGRGEEKCLGLGWYPRENIKGRPARRMGYFGIFYISDPQINVSGARYMKIYIYGRKNTKISILINNIPMHHEALKTNGWQTLRINTLGREEILKASLFVDVSEKLKEPIVNIAVSEVKLLIANVM